SSTNWAGSPSARLLRLPVTRSARSWNCSASMARQYLIILRAICRMISVMPNGPTISNSSCLIALDASGHIDLLQKLYTTITVPEAVARECGTALPSWAIVRVVQDKLLVQSLSLNLGDGESEAIALAMELTPVRLILDDKKARRLAQQLQLPTTGTLAILLRAKQQGNIPKVRDVLDALRASGFFVSEALVEQVLQSAGE